MPEQKIKFSEALYALTESKSAIIGLAGGLKFQIEVIEEYIETGKDQKAAQMAIRQIKQNYQDLKPYFNL